MTDIRLQRMAKVLVHYSIGVRKGDRMAIRAEPIAAPLVLEVVSEALHAGGHPEVFVTLPGLAEILYQQASDEQLRYIPAAQRIIIEEYETMLAILSQENTKSLSNINPERIAISQQAFGELTQTYLQRTRPMIPTAQDRCAGQARCFPPTPMPRMRRCL